MLVCHVSVCVPLFCAYEFKFVCHQETMTQFVAGGIIEASIKGVNEFV